jgi:GT2 family glycosyltransferase
VALQEQICAPLTYTALGGGGRHITPRISFIIPVFNGLQLTKSCLDSLRQTVDLSEHEVIIVDDQSTDGTREYLAGLPESPFRVLASDRRRGYAASNNVAADVARGEWLCLLNNDTVLRPHWLEPMLRAFQRFPNAGLVGNVQRNPRTGRYDHMGTIFTDNGSAIHFGSDFWFRPFRGYTRWKAVTAACCLIRRKVFLDAGGFDEQYMNGGEDVDLCLRLGQGGYQHYVANQSVIDHYVSSSEGRHAFSSQNMERLLQQWRSHVQGTRTNRDRRLLALNYLLSRITRPWRYNSRRLRHSLIQLTRPRPRD